MDGVENSLELSVVLVNHNGANCLPGALEALAAGTAESRVECIVVDSASSDGSWRALERVWPAARVLRFDENIGFCAGCNRGAEAARGRLLAFVNFDSRVETGWDAPLRTLLDGDARVSVATGLLLRADGETIEAAGLEIAPNMATYGRLENTRRERGPSAPEDVAAASGALMMVRRDEFLALGGFYEPLFMYGEEADYCLRAPGRVVLEPGSAVRHDMGHAAGPPRSLALHRARARDALPACAPRAGRHLDEHERRRASHEPPVPALWRPPMDPRTRPLRGHRGDARSGSGHRADRQGIGPGGPASRGGEVTVSVKPGTISSIGPQLSSHGPVFSVQCAPAHPISR